MNNWSLESEFCKLTDEANIEDALKKLHLLAQDESLSSIDVKNEWIRGGAETYIYSFDLISDKGNINPLILKAYVPSFSAVSIEDGLHNIFKKRRAIEGYGNLSPQLYAFGNGVWIEKRIPFDLKERISILTEDKTTFQNIINQLFLLAFTLDHLGFSSISPFDDLRTDDVNIFVVDFGQDMGNPEMSSKSNGNLEKLLDWIGKLAIPITTDILERGKNVGNSIFLLS